MDALFVWQGPMEEQCLYWMVLPCINISEIKKIKKSVLTPKVPANVKCNFQNELSNQQFYLKWKFNLIEKRYHNIKPSTFCWFQISFTGRKTFIPLKWTHDPGCFTGCHHSRRPCPAQKCCGDVSCPAAVATECNCGTFAKTNHKISTFALYDINTWWKRYIVHTVSRYGCRFERHVTYLPTSWQGWPQYELSYRGYFRQPVASEIVLTEK